MADSTPSSYYQLASSVQHQLRSAIPEYQSRICAVGTVRPLQIPGVCRFARNEAMVEVEFVKSNSLQYEAVWFHGGWTKDVLEHLGKEANNWPT